MKTKQGFAPVAVIVILVLLGAGAYVALKNRGEVSGVCTLDAKMCPDGSYVSRTPPSCEFAACPAGDDGEQAKIDNQQCPEGYTGRYEFDGTESHLIDCKPLPSDFGKICSDGTECEYDCLTTDADLIALECPKASCGKDFLQCKNIRGTCGAYGQSFRSINKEGQVNTFCPE